jgi:putative transposase
MKKASTRGVAFDADDIYKAIVDHQIAFDMLRGRIWESAEAVIFRDQSALEFYSNLDNQRPAEPVRKRGGVSVRQGAVVRVDGDSLSIQVLGDTRVLLERPDGSVWRMTSQVFYQGVHDGWIAVLDDRDESCDDIWSIPVRISEKAIARALFREQEIARYKTDKNLCTTPVRTIQRWMHDLSAAGKDLRAQEQALAGHEEGRGRKSRIPEWQILLIYEVAREVLNNHNAYSLLRGWREFKKLCKAKTEFSGRPCSYPTFCRYVRRCRLLDVRKREGNRVAENVRPITWHADVGEPVHGMRPLAVVHIDSTQVNLHARHPLKTISLGRPWLTVAYDAHSRKVLAAYISFRKPSYVSTMMVFRALILRTKGFAPELLVMDGGPEFKNKSLKNLLGHYRVQARWRKKPRQGCVIERLFGVGQQQFFHDLAGNSKFMVRVRQMTKETFPENRVSWTLTAIYYGFEFYADEIYGETHHPAIDAKPNEYFSARLYETGSRAIQIIPFDRIFLIETCPDVSSGGKRVVNNVRGVFVEGVWFHGPVLRRKELHGKPVQVKIDWWDPRMVYVLDPEGYWHTCFSRYFDRLSTATQAERKSAWQRLKQRTGRGKHLLDEEIQERYLLAYEAQNFDPILQTQEDEARRLYNGMNMTFADTEAWKAHYQRTTSPPRRAVAKTVQTTAGGRLKFSRPSRFDSEGKKDDEGKDERA